MGCWQSNLPVNTPSLIILPRTLWQNLNEANPKIIYNWRRYLITWPIGLYWKLLKPLFVQTVQYSMVPWLSSQWKALASSALWAAWFLQRGGGGQRVRHQPLLGWGSWAAYEALEAMTSCHVDLSHGGTAHLRTIPSSWFLSGPAVSNVQWLHEITSAVSKFKL